MWPNWGHNRSFCLDFKSEDLEQNSVVVTTSKVDLNHFARYWNYQGSPLRSRGLPSFCLERKQLRMKGKIKIVMLLCMKIRMTKVIFWVPWYWLILLGTVAALRLSSLCPFFLLNPKLELETLRWESTDVCINIL